MATDFLSVAPVLLTFSLGLQETGVSLGVKDYVKGTPYVLLGAMTRTLSNLTICSRPWEGNKGMGVGLRIVELGVFKTGCDPSQSSPSCEACLLHFHPLHRMSKLISRQNNVSVYVNC